MPDLTTTYKLKKPKYNEYADIAIINEDLDIIDGILEEIAGRKVEIPPDFDNPLSWVGCTRLTEDKGNGSYIEKIVTTAGNKLKAQRVTTRNGENDMTEAYTFYGEDGRTVQASYTVRTTKDSSGAVWREAIEEVQA